MDTQAAAQGGKETQKYIHVTVSFNSEPRAFEVKLSNHVHQLLKEAADDFGVGGEVGNLQLRRGNTILDPNTKIEDLSLTENEVLYLERRAPASGGAQ